MISILIADDHFFVRSGLSTWLSSVADFEVVGVASDGQEAIELCCELTPDVVLMDLSMPVLGGVAAIARLHELVPSTVAIALTTNHDAELVSAALAAGAVGYLLKDVEPEVLVASIRAALQGGLPLSPSIAADLFRASPAPKSLQASLTHRERQVLDLVADGMSNKQIARALGISDKTVRAHCGRIYQHLGVTDRTQAAVWAVRAKTHDATT